MDEQVQQANVVQDQILPQKTRGVYQFQPGNKFGQGRPKKAKSALENIRRRVLMVVSRRIFREKDLETVSTKDLLKFVADIMPKEGGIVAPQINYISNVPREDSVQPVIEVVQPQPIEMKVEESPSGEQPSPSM
jgi:hypothetical protein